MFRVAVRSNGSPTFNYDLNKLVISEGTAVGTVIGTLNGSDPEGSAVHYGIRGTDFLSVDRDTGNVILRKPVDREVRIHSQERRRIEYDQIRLIRSHLLGLEMTAIRD